MSGDDALCTAEGRDGTSSKAFPEAVRSRYSFTPAQTLRTQQTVEHNSGAQHQGLSRLQSTTEVGQSCCIRGIRGTRGMRP